MQVGGGGNTVHACGSLYSCVSRCGAVGVRERRRSRDGGVLRSRTARSGAGCRRVAKRHGRSEVGGARTHTQAHNILSNTPHRMQKQAHRITNWCVRSAREPRPRVLELVAFTFMHISPSVAEPSPLRFPSTHLSHTLPPVHTALPAFPTSPHSLSLFLSLSFSPSRS